VTNVRLSGLVLDGDAKPLWQHGSLLTANETKHLDVANCRLIGSAANGISLRGVSGWIKGCEMADIGETAILSQDANGLVIANNLIDKAAGGISIADFTKGGRPAVIQGNLIRNLFMRKDNELRGFGIAVEADSVVTGNVIEGAPAYGIMIGWGPYLRDVSVANNLIRDVLIGIAVSVDPAVGTARITKNSIAGAKEGAIRAMSGPAAIGPDLARERADTFANVAVYANVAP
jgi:putative cofactor-binding repeat protein